MAYTKLADITWSASSPTITGSIYYNYQRSGADMQYKVKIILDKLLYADSAYGYNILATIRLDGATKISAHQIKGNGTYASGGYTYETGWMTVANKTAGTTALSVNIYTTSDPDRINKTYSYSLTVAPAASGIDSAAGINTGNAVCVKWTPKNKDFTFNLTFAIGGTTVKSATGIKPGGTAQYTYDDYIIPHSAVPNANSATVTVTLATYSGSTKVGEASKTFTASVPADVMPAVSDMTVSAVNDVSLLGTDFAAGLSKASWTCNASAGTGATIKSIAFSFADQTQGGTASSGVTNTIKKSGSYTPSVTLTDSRGRKVTATGAAIEVLPYAAPSISGASAVRSNSAGESDGNGTYIAVQAVAVYSDLNGKNSAAIRFRTRSVGGTWSGYTPLNSGALNVVATFSVTQSYELEISVADEVGNSGLPLVFTIPTAEVTLHLRDGGKGAAFGKYAEQEALECAWDAYFDKNVQVAGTLKAGTLETVGAATFGGNVSGQYISGTWLRSTAHSDLGAAPGSYPVFHDGWIYSRTLAEMRADLAAYEAVPLTVVSERLTDLNYTARYYPMLGMCFVRIYGKINADLNTGYDYDLISVGSRVPSYGAALAVKCGKDCMAIAQSNGVISLRPMGENIAASSGWVVYISGFWFA